MVKIGMTRRLEPLEQVYELSGAAVPFRFDLHALIFSKDAVGLETELHRQFASQRVNQVNSRKEFFHATPAEVRDALQRFAGQHLIEFTEEPQALEWRAGRRTGGEAGAPAAGAGGVAARTA
ncbi:GIY-YIG nuclease family protein [Streptomyces sp. NBC_00631]